MSTCLRRVHACLIKTTSPRNSTFWVSLLGLSLGGCINKGDTHIGNDEVESRNNDEESVDTGGESESSSNPSNGTSGGSSTEPEYGDTTEADSASTEDGVPSSDVSTPPSTLGEPEPNAPAGNGGSTPAAGGAGSPEPSYGGAGGTAAAGAANGGSAGDGNPAAMPAACDGVKATPVSSLNLAPLEINESEVMSGLSADFDGEKFIVAWVSGTDLARFAAVNLDGSVEGQWDLARGTNEAFETTDTRVISSSTHPGAQATLVAWHDVSDGPRTQVEIYGNWVANDGSQERTSALPIYADNNASMNPRFDAGWLDLNGGTYGFGVGARVVTLSETGEAVSVSGGYNAFLGLASRASDFVSATNDGGSGHFLGRALPGPPPEYQSITNTLATGASYCGDFVDVSSCSARIVWAGPSNNQLWMVSGPETSVERFTGTDGTSVGNATALGSATSRVLDARYDADSDTVGILFSQTGASAAESAKVALRKGDFTVVANAGAVWQGEEIHSGQLVWAGDDLYAFWLAKPAGGGDRKIYMTQVLCR